MSAVDTKDNVLAPLAIGLSVSYLKKRIKYVKLPFLGNIGHLWSVKKGIFY
jgi:hypothetical protein